MIGWLNGCMHRWMDDRGTHGCMDERMDVWMNGWKTIKMHKKSMDCKGGELIKAFMEG